MYDCVHAHGTSTLGTHLVVINEEHIVCIGTQSLKRILIGFTFGLEQTRLVTVKNRVKDFTEPEPPFFLAPRPSTEFDRIAIPARGLSAAAYSHNSVLRLPQYSSHISASIASTWV